MIMVNPRHPVGEPSRSKPRFPVGQLVRHRRYGYRGVVVAVDLSCLADPTWYMANQTQPNRDQPWYHVLVHGRELNTYAAETSLLEDDELVPVDHPLVEVFFDGFVGGAHVRNAVPFPTEVDEP